MGTRVSHGPLLKITILYSDCIDLMFLASILGYFIALRLQNLTASGGYTPNLLKFLKLSAITCLLPLHHVVV